MQQMNPQDIRERVDQLLSNEVDRKDFIKYLGVGIIALTGAYSALKAVNQFSTRKSSVNLVGSRYGMSAYGGQRSNG